ncbi:hypothetical protein GZ78_29030 [Endozoicomonas numazuensis]|uniref:Uncharacterized protein n=2 Tax=Endozoicomonas numazuensis TaxID=1137799 RepID=A0A081MYS9_9GAMM|nr:hypothetical protein GZ78_29030 [Endozoicomonas numazuensis]
MDAIKNNDIRAVKRIIREGVDLNKAVDPDGLYTPLQYAALIGSVDIVKLFLNSGLSANCKRLNQPKRFGPYDLRCRPKKRFLQSSCASQYYQTVIEHPPLHLAVNSGNALCVQSLINAGSNIDQVSDVGWGLNTVLCSAAASGNVEVGKIILNENDNLINFIRPPGHSALYVAFYNHNFDFFLFLLQSGANPNIENFSGQSFLHNAVVNSNFPYTFVIALIQHGAQSSTTNSNGDIPLDLAHSNNDNYLIGVLTPATICCSGSATSSKHVALPSLQEWSAHYIRIFFSFQQILQSPLPQHLIIYILGTYGRRNAS